MRHLTATICLTLAVLLGSAGVSFALPACPSDQNQYYDNCFGTYDWGDDGKYVGEWKDNEHHGQGTFDWGDGRKYVGEWRDGKYNGQGTLTAADGRIWEGIWKDDGFQYAQKVTPPVVAQNTPVPSSPTVTAEKTPSATPRRGWSADYQKGLGAYRRGDYATAFREWKPLAEQGDSRAQFNLGWFYHFGKGVPQNVSTALKWYRRAAEQGNVNAQKNLKNMGKQVLSTSALPPCPKVGTRQHLNNCFGEFHSDRGKSWFGEFGQNGKLHGKGRHDGKNGIWNRGIFLGSEAQIYSLLTKPLSQIDTGKYVTYTGRTHGNFDSRPVDWGGYHRPGENFGPVTATLMVDQNGNLTGLGDFTFTHKILKNPGPHTGPIMFSLCAPWARSYSTPYTVSGTFGRTTIPTQFHLGWGHTYSSHKSNLGSGGTNCYGTGFSSDAELTPQQEKEKFDTNVLTGRIGDVFFTVVNAAYRETIRKEEQQKYLQIIQKEKEQSKPENILRGRYIEYITVRECRKLGFWYISSKQFDAAKSSIRSISDYFKSTYRNMDTDAIWESANGEWDKKLGGLFTLSKAVGGYNEDLNGICKLSSMSLSFVKIPGAKKKKRKKDFE